MPYPFTKILIVDDDPVSQYISKTLIQETGLAGQIITLANGQEALAYLQTHCQQPVDYPDVILLDINMPVMNGLELLAHLKAAHGDSIIAAAIVMLSSSTSQKDYEQIAHYPVKGIMQKPLTEDKLRSLVSLFSGGNQGLNQAGSA